MNTQQIASRAFRINFNDGFALANNAELLTWLINNNSGIHVVEAPNVEQAYFDACNQFVHDEWTKILIINRSCPNLRTYFARHITLPDSSRKFPRADFSRLSVPISSGYMITCKRLSNSWNISQ